MESEWGRVSILGGEKVLEVGSGDGCTALWVYLRPLHCMV